MLVNCLNISSYETVYSKLIKICEKQKNLVKDNPEYFVYDENTYNLINISLESVVNFFKTQTKNFGIYNEEEKIAFTKRIINSLIDDFNSLNLSNAEKEEDDILK